MSASPPVDPLAVLRVNYAKKLPEKFADLDAAAAGLETGDRLAAVQDVRNLVHKLAGSAPTFGFPELGDAARAVERACDLVLKDGVASDGAVGAIRAQLTDMKARADVGGPDRAAGTASQVGGAALSGRVLVVEDEPTQALFAQVVLKKAGLDVTIENNPLNVADRLADLSPQLVFLDMNMPGMNGDEVAQAIRARGDAVADVPIVFLSGEEDPVRREAAMQSGGNGFVSKPVQPAALLDAVRRFIQA